MKKPKMKTYIVTLHCAIKASSRADALEYAFTNITDKIVDPLIEGLEPYQAEEEGI